MATKLDDLIAEALESCRFRGHHMVPFSRFRRVAYSVCALCDAAVWVDTLPQPNGINISGTAVAVNCPHRE